MKSGEQTNGDGGCTIDWGKLTVKIVLIIITMVASACLGEEGDEAA